MDLEDQVLDLAVTTNPEAYVCWKFGRRGILGPSEQNALAAPAARGRIRLVHLLAAEQQHVVSPLGSPFDTELGNPEFSRIQLLIGAQVGVILDWRKIQIQIWNDDRLGTDGRGCTALPFPVRCLASAA